MIKTFKILLAGVAALSMVTSAHADPLPSFYIGSWCGGEKWGTAFHQEQGTICESGDYISIDKNHYMIWGGNRHVSCDIKSIKYTGMKGNTYSGMVNRVIITSSCYAMTGDDDDSQRKPELRWDAQIVLDPYKDHFSFFEM
jgi:hypothetical protein